MSDTPELDKNAAANDDWRTILEFMEWAAEKGYHFTQTRTFTETGERLHDGSEYEYEIEREIPVRVDNALYEFFEIDPIKLDRERRAVLADAAAANEQHRGTYAEGTS